MTPTIELLDGGFLYELRKQQKDILDYGESIIDTEPTIVSKIYQSYIDLGCSYITSGNYVFKPNRQNNWQHYTEKTLSLLHELKTYNDFTLLGCIPPYYESFTYGPFTAAVAVYYTKLKYIVEKYANIYIIETVVSYEHLHNIVKILDKSLPIIVSLYPKNDITVENLNYLIENFNIIAILLNCCSFDDMKEYFDSTISKIQPNNNKIKFGFYLNKIDEKKYVTCTHESTQPINLTSLYIQDDCDLVKIEHFMDNYKLPNNLIIGGCCGYGVKQINILKQIITKNKSLVSNSWI